MIGSRRALLAAALGLASAACVAAEGDGGAGTDANAASGDASAEADAPVTSVDTILPHAELRTYSYTCGSDTRVVANFRDRGLVWLFLPGRTVSLPQVRSASGARYDDGSTSFWIEGREARLETADTGPLDCTEHRRESFIEDAKLRGNDFWAVGNEPPWTLEIGPDSSVLYMGYERERHSFPTPDPVVDAAARRTAWSGETGLGAITIELVAEPCADDMSGEPFQVRVSVTLSGRLLRGCGQALH